MYQRCAYCDSPFESNDVIQAFPRGRRIALAPQEERWGAVEECERRFRGTRLRLSTANVGLARAADGVELLRIGAPLRPELAAWRWGDQFGRRRRRATLLLGTVAGTAAALALGGAAAIVLPAAAAAAVAVRGDRLRRLLEGHRLICRVPLPHGDQGVVRADRLGEARLLVGGPWGDRWGLLASYGTGAVVLEGASALRVAGVMLAHLNWTGASRADVESAVELLERHGGAARCFQFAACRPEHERHRLIGLPMPVRLALEMAAHEELERRVLRGELQLAERSWREEDAVATIADGLLSPG
jgi:hypothetical protein